LNGANLSYTHLVGANLFKAVLDGANLAEAFLTGAQFLNCAQLIVTRNWECGFGGVLSARRIASSRRRTISASLNDSSRGRFLMSHENTGRTLSQGRCLSI
jgi:hypothetical protein